MRGETLPIRILDEYLLTCKVSQNEVMSFLQELSSSKWSKHLHLVGLETFFSSPQEITRIKLLRLRFLLIDQANPSESILQDLTKVGEIYRALDALISDTTNIGIIRKKIESIRKDSSSEIIHLLTYGIVYGFAMYSPSHEMGTFNQIDLVNIAIITQERLRKFWHSIFDMF